jgi:hypothetical protein
VLEHIGAEPPRADAYCRGPVHENRPVAGRRLRCRERVPVALAAVWAVVTSRHPQTTG